MSENTPIGVRLRLWLAKLVLPGGYEIWTWERHRLEAAEVLLDDEGIEPMELV